MNLTRPRRSPGRSRPTPALLITAALAVLLVAVPACRRQTVDGPAQAFARAQELSREADALLDQAADDNREERAERRTDEALTKYREALRLEPDFGHAWNNVGWILLSRGAFVDAQQAFQRAANASPNNHVPLYNIGYTYLTRGWARQSLQYFDRALELQPEHRDSLRASVQAAAFLEVADEKSLERVRTAILHEVDDDWLQYLQRQQFRIEARLRLASDRPTY